MQTPTHTLLALAALGRKGTPRRNIAVVAGSLVPDLFIYVAWPWLTFVRRESQERIWSEIYFDVPMQTVGAIFNSAPLYAVMAAIGWRFREKVWGSLAMVFALAALIHIASDLPVHADDAHRHFWPITDLRFFSPISYWDPAHHGRWVGTLEALLGISLCTLLFFRFRKWLTRASLVVLGLLYVGVIAYMASGWL